jgi:hypothetical protein
MSYTLPRDFDVLPFDNMPPCDDCLQVSRSYKTFLFNTEAAAFVLVKQGDQVSISPILYEQLFCTKVFCIAFMCLQFGLVIFWQKDFGAKAAHKMLGKLTPDFFSKRTTFGGSL